MEEVFVDIKDYEGFYKVSNTGKVFSCRRQKYLLPKSDKDGYKEVCLCVGEVRKYKRVHRLVAEAFIPNEEYLPIINHKDGDKTNNHVSNLEWTTNYGNVIHGFNTNIEGKTLSSLSKEEMLLIVDMYRSGYKHYEISERFNLKKQKDGTIFKELSDGRVHSKVTGIRKASNVKSKGGKVELERYTKAKNILIDYFHNNLDKEEIVDKYGVTKAYAEQILSGKLRKLLYLEVTTSIAP
jgi:hypothetical protein